MRRPLNGYRLYQMLKEGGPSHSLHFKVDVGQVAPLDFRYRVVGDRLDCEVTFLDERVHMPDDVTDDKFRNVAATFEQAEA